jgi:hypothetical protein
LQPHCHFYNLFACSGARFTEENYSAGWEVFNDDWGLFAVGSTKTGSMLPGTFGYYYTPIGTGSCVGDAFKSWFVNCGEDDRDWHYGLSLIGDPTLKPRHGTADCSLLAAGRDGGGQPLFSEAEKGAVPPRPLTADVVGANPETDANPVMTTAPDGKVWVVWVSGRTAANGRFDVYGAYHTTGGWSAAMAIGTAYYWEYNPALAIDNAGRPVCVWSVFEDSYHYTLHYSVWSGSAWSASTQIADNSSEDLQSTLTRDSSGRLWCCWQSRHGPWGDIWARYWNGSVWSAASKVTAGDTALHLYPCAATDDSGRAWVFYTRYDQGKSEVWGSYYTGSSWVRSGPASGTRRRALRPAAARGSGRFWVAWQDFDDGNGEIYASYRDGSTWSSPVKVSTSPALDVHPAMARDGAQGAPWIVWQSKASGNWNVFASRHDGSLWTEPLAVDSNGGFNLNPAVFGMPEGISFIWQNFQPGGNWEVYAKCLPLTGTSEGPGRIAEGIRLAGSPNPTSGRAKLSYVLGRAGSGRLAVYDRQGRLALDLGTVRGSGTLRCPDLATGVYFARLSAGSELAETKLVLTR